MVLLLSIVQDVAAMKYCAKTNIRVSPPRQGQHFWCDRHEPSSKCCDAWIHQRRWWNGAFLIFLDVRRMVLLRGVARDVAAMKYCASKLSGFHVRDKDHIFDVTGMIWAASAATPESTKGDDVMVHVQYFWMSDEWNYSVVSHRMSQRCNIVLHY